MMAMETTELCKCRISVHDERIVFTDENGVLYLWEADEGLYSGINIYITAFAFNDKGILEEVDTPRSKLLIEHIKRKEETLSKKALKKYIWSIYTYEFEIPDLHWLNLGYRLCRWYIEDIDKELIFGYKDAKHALIDFEKLEKDDILHIKTPPLFPFEIKEAGVIITEDAKMLTKEGKQITTEEFHKRYDAFRQDILPKLEEKERELEKIEKRLGENYFLAKQWMEGLENNDETSPTPTVDVYDKISDTGIPIHKIYYSEGSFTDTEKYSLSFWGFPKFKVCNLFYYLFERLGDHLLDAELTLYLDVEMMLQKKVTLV